MSIFDATPALLEDVDLRSLLDGPHAGRAEVALVRLKAKAAKHLPAGSIFYHFIGSTSARPMAECRSE